ncbi:hypothetical protein PCO85_13905 [Prodigiosinella aquatilis]|nr:hypothetical protein [Prodigiosinella sp. LS101]WJV52334.1 hypothetical protein PCO85_13905 [Prodigiosinella sp. LS101]WJV56689.1 hypothetical protein PCO84_13895 [Pectobacteriaceae bacterium C111]
MLSACYKANRCIDDVASAICHAGLNIAVPNNAILKCAAEYWHGPIRRVDHGFSQIW